MMRWIITTTRTMMMKKDMTMTMMMTLMRNTMMISWIGSIIYHQPREDIIMTKLTWTPMHLRSNPARRAHPRQAREAQAVRPNPEPAHPQLLQPKRPLLVLPLVLQSKQKKHRPKEQEENQKYLPNYKR